MPRRRDFLRYSGGVVAAGLAGVITGASVLAPARAGAAVTPQGATPAAAGPEGHPDPPPAAPLAVRGPYVSTWLPATVSPATWQEFWQGHTTAMGGIPASMASPTCSWAMRESF